MIRWEAFLKGKTVDRQWQGFKARINELQKLFFRFEARVVKGLWPNYGLKGKLAIVSDSNKMHTNWQEKALVQRIGSSLKFSKGEPRDLLRKGKQSIDVREGNIKTYCKRLYRYIKRKRLSKTNVGH